MRDIIITRTPTWNKWFPSYYLRNLLKRDYYNRTPMQNNWFPSYYLKKIRHPRRKYLLSENQDENI